MKNLKHILFFCLLVVLAACTDDALVPQSEVMTSVEGDYIDMISMVVPDIEIDDATTRSKLIDDGSEIKFEWQENDAIGVIPMSGSPLHFPIHAENAGKNTALFDGGDWALKTSTKYAAFFPYNKEIADKDIKSIPIDYTGQTQSNYANYDFLATGAIKPTDGSVKFTMQRLSAILKISITMPDGANASYCTLVAPTDAFGVKGTLDLSGTEPVYNVKGKSKFINTELLRTEWYHQDAITYTIYMMIPPTDLSGKALSFRLISEAGYAYEAPLDGQNFEAGKAYQLSGTADGACIRNQYLIEAAEANEGVSFYKNDSLFVPVNDNLYEIEKVKSINVSWKRYENICDEICYFTALEKLNCYNCTYITSLDLSNNPALTYLSCYSNQLTSLDLSKNTALTSLDCSGNKLTSLDVSKNTELTYLACDKNQLTSLDVSNNTKLNDFFDCSNNQLTSLDISNNTNLRYFRCSDNKLTSLILPSTSVLYRFYCGNNQLTSLDVSGFPNLREFSCSDNKLTSLDVSNNPSLGFFYCHNNQLTSLDLSKNTGLESFGCKGNPMTSLDISNCPELYQLYFDDCQITSIDLSQNTDLQYVGCTGNKLTTLDLSQNVKLEKLYCDSNQLTMLGGLTNCTELSQLECFDNNLTTLNLKNCTKLSTLYCYNNQLTSLYLTNCTGLRYLYCHENKLTSLDLSTCTSLYNLRCYSNQLTSLDFSNCTSLWELCCYDNKLTSINVTNCPSLYIIYCYSNQLTSSGLDLSNNSNLNYLYCYDNHLDREFSVSNNTKLSLLYCYSNHIQGLSVADCSNLGMSGIQCGEQTTVSGSAMRMTLTVNATQYANRANFPSNNNSRVDIVQTTVQ